MKTNLLLLLCILFQFSLSAQHETRNVGPFDGINVAGHYDVTLVEGKEGVVKILGNQDDLDLLETYVKGTTLIIKKKKEGWYQKWKFENRKVKIEVSVVSISKVNLSGSGSIVSQFALKNDRFDATLSGSGDINIDIDTKTLYGQVTGSGDIVFNGKATDVDFTVTGSGSIIAKEVEASNGEAIITGSGDIEMYARQSLNGNITGSGDLVCYGVPERQKTKVTGSGNISIRN